MAEQQKKNELQQPPTLFGLIGKKIGTTEIVRETGEVLGVTAILAGPCMVTQVKTKDKDGYDAVQLGFEESKNLSKPEKGHLKGAGKNFRHLREFGASDFTDITVGQEVGVDLFALGDRVDATSLSKGRGFAGGVKRHHFRGGPATHGQSDRHRAPGSIGAGTTPGRVVKGHKMAGHMGNATTTVRNLEVVATDRTRNVLMVFGSIPGARNSLVLLNKTRSGQGGAK